MKIHGNFSICPAALHSEFGVVLHQVHSMRLQGWKPKKNRQLGAWGKTESDNFFTRERKQTKRDGKSVVS